MLNNHINRLMTFPTKYSITYHATKSSGNLKLIKTGVSICLILFKKDRLAHLSDIVYITNNHYFAIISIA